MHFALINWITASLPSHANLLGVYPFLSFVSPPFLSRLSSLKFFKIYASLICHTLSFGALLLSFIRNPHSFFPFNYSLHFTQIYFLFRTLLIFSFCTVYGFAVHYYVHLHIIFSLLRKSIDLLNSSSLSNSAGGFDFIALWVLSDTAFIGDCTPGVCTFEQPIDQGR